MRVIRQVGFIEQNATLGTTAPNEEFNLYCHSLAVTQGMHTGK